MTAVKSFIEQASGEKIRRVISFVDKRVTTESNKGVCSAFLSGINAKKI
jgi:hypothetical protein